MDLSPQNGRMSVVCEATWHMSMIELLLWSTPHTNGVITLTDRQNPPDGRSAHNHFGPSGRIARAAHPILPDLP
jgi:hypothetical protein